MIGKDVVDLSHPGVQPGARHVRFDARVFDRSEREALATSGAPDRLRWMYWAAKEAAYKVVKKLDGATVWSPRRFKVELDANLTGHVLHEGRKLPVLIEQDGAHVHAIASDTEPSSDAQRWQVGQLVVGEEEGLAARALAITGLAPTLGLDTTSLRFGRRGRIPLLYQGGELVEIDLSLSHHGGFVAWAADLRGAEASPQ